MTLAEWLRVPKRVPSGQVGAMMAASRHREKAVSARVCGVDLEVASDDEGEGAGAGVGADGGENGEVVGAQAAPGDEVRE